MAVSRAAPVVSNRAQTAINQTPPPPHLGAPPGTDRRHWAVYEPSHSLIWFRRDVASSTSSPTGCDLRQPGLVGQARLSPPAVSTRTGLVVFLLCLFI